MKILQKGLINYTLLWQMYFIDFSRKKSIYKAFFIRITNIPQKDINYAGKINKKTAINSLFSFNVCAFIKFVDFIS